VNHSTAGLKPLSDWDEDYLLSLPAEEFDWIEYKASAKFQDPGWHDEMSKYVSAWGNYDGGYIVFGIENPSSGSIPVIDGGVPENVKPKLADWLDTVIPSLVEPRLEKVSTSLIRPRSEASRIHAGNVIIVIHIPESPLAPHQARDHKYYQRIGRRLNPIGHRAIQDIAGRRRYPKLRTTIRIYTGVGLTRPSMFWKLENLGSVLASRWMVIVRFPTNLNGHGVVFKEEKKDIRETDDGKSFLELRIHQKINTPPLFPKSDISGSFALSSARFDPPLKPSITSIRVTTYADDMPPFDEIIPLSDALRESGALRIKGEAS
jgi:Putative DNA-binding domain